MKSILRCVAIAATLTLVSVGCDIFIEVEPDTTLRAENEMVDLEVTVNGTTSEVDGIDLFDVTVGDIQFSEVLAGTITSSAVTERSGSVNVFIGSADASVASYPLGIRRVDVYTFEDIDPMGATIIDGELNTVTFDETTAGDIISALAKKMAKSK